MKTLLSTLAALTISVPVLADDQFSLTTGFDYSTGKYGNAISTNITYVPLIAQYETDDLTLKLIVPYISVTGPGGVVRGFGRVVSPASMNGAPAFGRPGRGGGMTTTTTSTTATTSNSGLGDVVASAGYTAYSDNALILDIVGKIKFGTADANKGLGTGENDYSLQLDGYYTLPGKTTLFATAGYKIVGAPVGVTVNNVPYGMIGASQKVSDSTSAGLMLNVVKSATAAGSDQRDVTVYASRKLSRSWKLQANLLKGFADGSPDYGGGLMITAYF